MLERTTKYSLWSRGRLIGHTTLDFYPFRCSRMGWLELTELGERLADSIEQLELELRDAAGRVVPTRHVSAQDTDRLGADADDLLDDSDAEVEPDETTFDDEFAAALIELGMAEPPVWDEGAEIRSEPLDEPELPRFQVYVELERADSVPIAERWKDDPDVKEMLAELQRGRDGVGGGPSR